MRGWRSGAPTGELGEENYGVVGGGGEVVVRGVEDAVVAIVAATAHGVLIELHRCLTIILRVDALHESTGV